MRTVVWLGLAVVLSASCANAQSNRQPYFGELHIHTGWSFDAYVFNVRATPDHAYEFGKGAPLKHPAGKEFQLSRPLDFMAVTDHCIYMGVMAKMADPNHPLSKHPMAATVNDPDPDVMVQAFLEIVRSSREGRPIEGLTSPAIQQETWEQIVAAANRHYEPGKFTTFIAYEWTSTPDGQNLHRNVIFKGDDAPVPYTRFDSDRPEDLWKWLDEVRANGHEVLAIPHNSNLSDGRMFERVDSWDQPFTAEYAAARTRNEPLVEVTQVKGTSETHPALSPNDEFADFELVEQRVASNQPVTNFAGSYVRDAYLMGLELQDTQGFNPYKFGLVGASDSHTGIVPVEENHYSGKVGSRDGTAERRLLGTSPTMDVRFFSASGLTGVWAEENTRESIYDALRRNETWATTGTRIKVRFFGGYDVDVDLASEDWVDEAYSGGVPMGGALKATADGKAPEFVVWALKDPDGANLDRIQVVKGWSENGEAHERVYDAVWSGEREIDAETRKLPAVGNTVDLETLEYRNSIGAVELKAIWRDPEFSAGHNAFYYLRVLEIPTPRWNLFDARDLGIENPPDLDMVIQERAYTSPIWYDHH